MASQATRQRKGVSAPKSGEILNAVSMDNSVNNHAAVTPTKTTTTKVAKVKRNKFGTAPFDKYWLNLDCCGLFCASITYMLHIYGVYATCFILIPPWMSSVDPSVGRLLP